MTEKGANNKSSQQTMEGAGPILRKNHKKSVNSKRVGKKLLSTLMELKHKNHSHLYSTDIDLADFEVIKVIGRGSYAKVYLI